MTTLTVMQTQKRKIHTINFASSLYCSMPLGSQVFFSFSISNSWLSVYSLFFTGVLQSLPAPEKSCLAKCAQLLCLPDKGFTKPVMQVARTMKQDCLPLCCSVQNRKVLHRRFLLYMGRKEADAAATLYHTAHQSMLAALDRILIDHHRQTTAWGCLEMCQHAFLHAFP